MPHEVHSLVRKLRKYGAKDTLVAFCYRAWHKNAHPNDDVNALPPINLVVRIGKAQQIAGDLVDKIWSGWIEREQSHIAGKM